MSEEAIITCGGCGTDNKYPCKFCFECGLLIEIQTVTVPKDIDYSVLKKAIEASSINSLVVLPYSYRAQANLIRKERMKLANEASDAVTALRSLNF